MTPMSDAVRRGGSPPSAGILPSERPPQVAREEAMAILTSTEAHEAWRSTNPGHRGRSGDDVFTPHAQGCTVPLRRTEPPETGDGAGDWFGSDVLQIGSSRRMPLLSLRKQAFYAPVLGQRTRFDHSVAVARISATIAIRLGLHGGLAFAVGLGHDCGHTPGGHAGEEALDALVPGGFDHAPNGRSVFEAYGSGVGLKDETLDGIANHSWSRPSPKTPEAQVAAVADRIEYTTGDLADGALIGLSWKLSDATTAFLGDTVAEWRRALVDDVVATSHRVGYVALSQRAMSALHELRDVCSRVVYLRPASVAENAAMRRVVTALAEYQVGILLSRGFPEALAWKATVAEVCALGDDEACRIAVAEAGVKPSELPLTTAQSSGSGARTR